MDAAPQKSFERFFRSAHEKCLIFPLYFLWGALLLPRIGAEVRISSVLALAAAGFVSGAFLARKWRALRECTILFFSLFLIFGSLLPFAGMTAVQWAIFGFWLHRKEDHFPPSGLAPLFLAGGFFELVSPGEGYRFLFLLFILLFLQMLTSFEGSRRGKLVRLALSCVIFLLPLREMFPRPMVENSLSCASPRTLIAALGAVSREKPSVLILSGNADAITRFYQERFLRVSLCRELPEKFRVGECYDLIIADISLGKNPGMAEFLSHRLTDGGVILLPAKECAALPDFHWITMPDDRGTCPLMLGAKRPFRLTPGKIETNLSVMGFSDHFPLVPGAIPGYFVDYQPEMIAVSVDNDPVSRGWFPPLSPRIRKLLSLLPLLIVPLLLIVLEILAFRKKERRSALLAGESAFAFAAITALLLENYPYEQSAAGTAAILSGIALIWLFCRPSLRIRMEILMTIAGILTALIWSIRGGRFWLIFSLVAGGIAFAGEMRRKEAAHPEKFTFSLAAGLCLGFLAVAVSRGSGIPVRQLLWAALTLKIWTTVRN